MAGDRRPTAPSRARRRWGRGLTVLAGVAAASLVWLITVSWLGVDLTVRRSADLVGPITLPAVVVTSLAAGVAGWLLLALLERWAPARAGTIWRAVGGTVLAVSLLGPVSAASGVATVALMGLHGLVAAVLLTGLPRGRALAAGPGSAPDD